VPHWMHSVNWTWMGAMMIVWLVLIGVIGYAAALLAWREANRHERTKNA
jgi:hypothetical protein